ncbi:MAG: MATE family efflux transporter [Erysipelotrichaceae bacterium]
MVNNELLEMRISRIYIRYLIPTIIGMVTSSIYCLSDVFFISVGVGANGLAALNIAIPIFTMFSAIGLLFGVGGATTISISEGAKDLKTKNKAFTLAIVASIAVGIIITLMGLVLIEPFAYALGSSKALLPLVKEYAFPILVTGIPAILAYSLQVLIRADQNPMLVMIATVSSSVLNIVLDYVFVIYFDMGMFGASFATAISPVVSCLILSFHYFKSERTVHFVKEFWDYHLLRRIVGNGFGSCLLEISAGIVVVIFNFMILKVGGELYLAAYAIITNIAYVIKGLLNGFAQAIQPIISINHGAKLFHRVKHSFRVAIVFTCGFAIITYSFMLLFPKQVTSIFANGDYNLIQISAKALVLYFSSLLFTAANTIILYYLQSIEERKLAMFLTICRGFIFIVIGILALSSLFGMNGIWFTVCFGEVITFIISIPFLITRLGKHLEVAR